ncbi:MAG: methyltransferase domain-containing protein [Fluviicola sp.]|nr:methyltransferase domain-containing protein [Fluviicola sp.]
MTCAHCCGAESIFDKKEAKKNLKSYRKKGPNKTTKILINALVKENVKNLSLLDIGGGIGVIQHELLKKGASKTTDIDASAAYIDVVKEIMNNNKTEDKMNFIHGDFVDVSESIEAHDIVTLERVVCCYPDAKALINESTSKAKKYYAFVYPMDTFLSRMLNKLLRFYLFLKRNPFRTFIHSEKMMNELILSKNFENIFHGKAFPWRISVYRRIDG